MRQIWAVEIRVDDNDPQVFGPYTEAQAERVAARLREEVALSTDSYGASHHPHDLLGAIAYPMSRYDSFLTGEQRRQARQAARKPAPLDAS